MKSIASMAAAIAVAVIIVGCGGGSSSDGSEGSNSANAITTSSLTKAQFVKQALAICYHEKANMLNRLSAYFTQHQNSKETEKEVFADTLRAVYLPTVETEIAKIRALGAPAGDEDEIEAFLVAEQKAVDAVAKLKSATSRFQVEAYFLDGAKLARAYGIDNCGNSSMPG